MKTELPVGHTVELRRSRTGLGCPSAKSIIRRAVQTALQAEGVDEPALVSVLLTDDETIRTLNAQFREIDRATDVLSFPMNELEPGAFCAVDCERDEETSALLLGDMVLSLERAAAQAEEYGHTLEREIAYLTVHSVLHLLGYDHVDEGPQKAQMRAREEAILGALGIVRA